jgi:L-lactate utilization protein LutB
MSNNPTQLTPEQQLQNLAAEFNHQVRKNRNLLQRLADLEDTRADKEARYVAVIEELQAALQQEQEASTPSPDVEVVPNEDVEVSIPS